VVVCETSNELEENWVNKDAAHTAGKRTIHLPHCPIHATQIYSDVTLLAPHFFEPVKDSKLSPGNLIFRADYPGPSVFKLFGQTHDA
jgi:hypothetical protein